MTREDADSLCFALPKLIGGAGMYGQDCHYKQRLLSQVIARISVLSDGAGHKSKIILCRGTRRNVVKTDQIHVIAGTMLCYLKQINHTQEA